MSKIDATTTARVKALLDIDSSDSTYDTVLGVTISAVSHRIENFIDRQLIQTARVEEYNIPPRTQTVFLRQYPVTTITSVKTAADWDFAGATAFDSDDYHVDEDNGLLYLKFYPVSGAKVMQVSYTAGFATSTSNLITNYPAIAYAADIQTVAAFRRRDSPQGKTMGIHGSSMSYEGPLQLVPDVIDALTPYRRLRFGAASLP